ncbi:Rho termination factor N-terminal domain-containing protein, partial [Actinotalea sp.]|uniref:Rho termination factor N-terminal domain-containing protein n=1 Tax=Actinotalea sp. TaxID=1872145 RepID=UPI002CB4C227
MSDTIEAVSAAPGAADSTSRSGALSTLRLPELQALAAELGVPRTSAMRKGDLVTAIREVRAGGSRTRATAPATAPDAAAATAPATAPAIAPATEPAAPVRAAARRTERAERTETRTDRSETRTDRSETRTDAPSDTHTSGGESADERAARAAAAARSVTVEGRRSRRAGRAEGAPVEGQQPPARDQQAQQREGQAPAREVQTRQQGDGQQGRVQGDGQTRQQGDGQQRQQGQQGQATQSNPRLRQEFEDDEQGGRRRRGRYRDRDRNKRRPGRPGQPDMTGYDDVEVSDDDILLPVAGILDIKDNYAFVRTSGYLPGDNDVYVSTNQVKKYGMRKGDAIIGAVRQPREGDPLPQGRNSKVNALVRLDSINGMTPEQARGRADFGKLTPLYPQERLRLETLPNILTTRVIDLVAPIGKGQRGLIVSPPKAGKTLVLQAIANAITTNNPEVHLMVVLVDER